MEIFFRKSVKLGPVRLNFSKSNVGVALLLMAVNACGPVLQPPFGFA
jgi:hypothetical protein